MAQPLAYVSQAEIPPSPPPNQAVGAAAWIRNNLFSTPMNSLITITAMIFVAWAVPPLVNWLFFDAVWEGTNRDACLVPGGGHGAACWAFVKAKLGQFIYGRYPLDERWRVDLVFFLFAAGLIPLAIPKVPYKRANALFLLGIFPILTLVLLTGGDLDFSRTTNSILAAFLAGALLLSIATRSPAGLTGLSSLALKILLVGVALFILGIIASFIIPTPAIRMDLGSGPREFPLGSLALALASIAAVVLGVISTMRNASAGGWGMIGTVLTIPAAMLIAYAIVTIDFGLAHVETPLWGGLMLTMVIAVVGIVASLPLGILLALGRKSDLPVVKTLSIAFIEFWRGVPLITVLFMASVMLPLFLPAGVNFDKLMRALIGVALFSAAYMAEVIRGGLQAIPKGQYEGAAAMGLTYWPAMRLIILPQALRIVIPGIVNSFISLFKDTSLVLIIGLFDLLGIIQQNFSDPNWATPVTPATGFAFAAAIYWVFCFSMSRYSVFMERRLNTGHR
ncbi:amino acid ABC transporter permease [Flaviflagellibacter deserti]|uniref:Amino acid ABC transporter permease n=1 Tax=Flaviflagellibacter deserti TaxID=2267266 RepID=A0ABV9Z4L9_9HYPH